MYWTTKYQLLLKMKSFSEARLFGVLLRNFYKVFWSSIRQKRIKLSSVHPPWPFVIYSHLKLAPSAISTVYKLFLLEISARDPLKGSPNIDLVQATTIEETCDGRLVVWKLKNTVSSHMYMMWILQSLQVHIDANLSSGYEDDSFCFLSYLERPPCKTSMVVLRRPTPQ